MDFWDAHAEKLFCSDSYIAENCNINRQRCIYFENVYTSHQLINFFGTIACRIFLNLATRNFFVGKMNNQDIYRYYAKFTKKLFVSIGNNVRSNYANEAIYNLKPFIDYDPAYLKIVNLKFTEYLEKCV